MDTTVWFRNRRSVRNWTNRKKKFSLKIGREKCNKNKEEEKNPFDIVQFIIPLGIYIYPAPAAGRWRFLTPSHDCRRPFHSSFWMFCMWVLCVCVWLRWSVYWTVTKSFLYFIFLLLAITLMLSIYSFIHLTNGYCRRQLEQSTLSISCDCIVSTDIFAHYDYAFVGLSIVCCVQLYISLCI